MRKKSIHSDIPHDANRLTWRMLRTTVLVRSAAAIFLPSKPSFRVPRSVRIVIPPLTVFSTSNLSGTIALRAVDMGQASFRETIAFSPRTNWASPDRCHDARASNITLSVSRERSWDFWAGTIYVGSYAATISAPGCARRPSDHDASRGPPELGQRAGQAYDPRGAARTSRPRPDSCQLVAATAARASASPAVPSSAALQTSSKRWYQVRATAALPA